jgi:hypothetical protein
VWDSKLEGMHLVHDGVVTIRYGVRSCTAFLKKMVMSDDGATILQVLTVQ